MAESPLACCVYKRTNLRQQFCLGDRSHKLIAGILNFWARISSRQATEELLAKVRSNKSARQCTQSARRIPAASLGSHGQISGAGANFTDQDRKSTRLKSS